MAVIFVLAAALLVAYANGANDNFKGVATLFGSGTTDYRRALRWGTATTFAGGVTALVASAGLVKAFSGAGLVPNALVGAPSFVASVALGASLTVLAATLLSLPISTTHALTGALVGAGLVLGGEVHFAVLGKKFFLPLAVSPFLALSITALLYPALRRLRLALGIARESCVCVEGRWVPLSTVGGASAAATVAEPSRAGGAHAAANASLGLQGGAVPLPVLTTCQQRYSGAVLAVDAQQAITVAHYASAGAVSFARGLNDTPKIAALLLAAQAVGLRHGMLLVAIAMAAGAILQARRVAQTMSQKITEMNAGQGFTANLVTALLVIVASRFGLPVSTTHVSCGSLFGLGAVTGTGRWGTVTGIVLAWLVTLPAAAALAAATAAIVRAAA